MTQWISVKDDFPNRPVFVLVLLDGEIPAICSYTPRRYEEPGNWYETDHPHWNKPKEWKDVTHWMPIPELPS